MNDGRNQPAPRPARRGSPNAGSGDFSSLLQREFKPKSDQAREAVENAVKTLAEQALQYTPLISKTYSNRSSR